jgi:hypothetical protein
VRLDTTKASTLHYFLTIIGHKSVLAVVRNLRIMQSVFAVKSSNLRIMPDDVRGHSSYAGLKLSLSPRGSRRLRAGRSKHA